MKPKPRLGPVGEQIAVNHLKKNGFDIVEENYRIGRGEIDVIARQGKV